MKDGIKVVPIGTKYWLKNGKQQRDDGPAQCGPQQLIPGFERINFPIFEMSEVKPKPFPTLNSLIFMNLNESNYV